MSRYASNTVAGFLNLVALLASIPIIAGGLWLARSNTTCEHTLQTPLLILGFVILLISLLGFIGACFDVLWAFWLYLVVMLFLIVAFMAITAFGYVVASHGGGAAIPGRKYDEYRLEGYSPWLRDRIKDQRYWRTIQGCVMSSRTCDPIITWTPVDYMVKNMSPIQSGCCKPPTSCVYNTETQASQDPDCYRWSNDPMRLCYDCDSCKAGVLEDVKRMWHRVTLLNAVLLLILIVVYSIGCCAFHNSTREAGSFYFPYYGRRQGLSDKLWPRRHNYWFCC